MSEESELALFAFAGLIVILILQSFRRSTETTGDVSIYTPGQGYTYSNYGTEPMPQNPGLSLSPQGADFIKGFEKFSPRKIPDGSKFQIGWGHNILPSENFPEPMSMADADTLFNQDVSKAEQSINSFVGVPLTQQQFDALVSLVYNIGVHAFQLSHLLIYLNQQNYDAAGQEFARWNKIGSTVSAGLTSRRAAEQQMFYA